MYRIINQKYFLPLVLFIKLPKWLFMKKANFVRFPGNLHFFQHLFGNKYIFFRIVCRLVKIWESCPNIKKMFNSNIKTLNI